MTTNLSAHVRALILPCPGCGNIFRSVDWSQTPQRDYEREMAEGNRWAFYKPDPESEMIKFGPCGCTLQTRANIQIWAQEIETRKAEFPKRNCGDGETSGCVDGTWYSSCPEPDCTGMCEMKGDCLCCGCSKEDCCAKKRLIDKTA